MQCNPRVDSEPVLYSGQGKTSVGDFDCNLADCITAISEAEDIAQQKRFVWYSTFGSNLSSKRMSCYIQGGRVEGMSRNCIGARDRTPMRDSLIKWMPYRVFFAHISDVWGIGGGAMLDVSQGQSHKCCMRLYKLTLHQFNDVVAQENKFKVLPLPEAYQLTCAELDNLQQRAIGSHLMKFKEEDTYYPAVVYLGDHDGIPVVSFSCPPERVNAFLNGGLPAAPPSNAYLAIMTKGLQECGMTQQQAEAYWEERVRSQTFINYNYVATKISNDRSRIYSQKECNHFGHALPASSYPA